MVSFNVASPFLIFFILAARRKTIYTLYCLANNDDIVKQNPKLNNGSIERHPKINSFSNVS